MLLLGIGGQIMNINSFFYCLALFASIANPLYAMQAAIPANWYEYARSQGLQNPVKVEVENLTSNLILVVYKKGAANEGNYGYDMVQNGKTMQIVYGIPGAIPFPQFIVKTKNIIYILDFEPKAGGGFKATLSRSGATDIIDPTTSTQEMMQLAIVAERQTIEQTDINLGDVITIVVKEDGARLSITKRQ